MRKRRFAVCAALLLALCVAFASCGAYQKTETVVYVITKGTSSDFWKSVRAGVSAAAVENGVTAIFEGPANEEDYAAQTRMIDEAVEAGADAIVFSAIDRYATKKHLEDAVRRGVKVILIDSSADTEMAECFIGTDNYAAGKMVCEAVLDGMGTDTPLKVGLVNYDENTENGSSREAGFRDRAAEAENIEIVASVHVASDTDIAKLTAMSMMREHPDINVLVGFNEWMTLGVGYAMQELGTAAGVYAVGFDSNVQSVAMLETGEMDALIVQNPFAMGYLGVASACDAVAGRAVDKNVDTATTVVTGANMFEPDIQKILYRFE